MKSLIDRYIEKFDEDFTYKSSKAKKFPSSEDMIFEITRQKFHFFLRKFHKDLIEEIEESIPKFKKLDDIDMSFAERAGFNTCLNQVGGLLEKLKYDYPQENTNDEVFSMGQNNQGIS